jgi:trigger factor
VSTHQTELETSTAHNDNVIVKVTRYPHCLVKFEITVGPQATATAYQKAMKDVTKEVSIPGFRKGKAPHHLISEKYSSLIQKEWVDIVLQTAFQEAIHLAHIHPLKDGVMKRPVIHSCKQETGAHFTLEFEARPTIPSVNIDSLQLDKIEAASITQEQKDAAFERLQHQFTTYESIEGRAVQEDDFVNVDIETLENSPTKVADNQRMAVNEKGMPQWLRQKIIGLQVGETAEGMTEPTANQDESKSVAFRVTVKNISKAIIPTIDDELAKKVGLNQLDELKEKVEKKLEQENQQEVEQRQFKEIDEWLLKNYPIDLPQSLIDSDKQERINHYIDRLKQEHQESYFEAHHQEIEEMMQKSSERGLTLFFLLRKIATDHQIEVNQQEINEELNRQLALIPSGRSSLDIYHRENMGEQLYALALDHKVHQFLLDHLK